MIDRTTTVELEGVNGERFILAGPDSGDQGIYLATGVTGLYDPPVKVVYEEPGNYPGARYLSSRILRRDIVFAVWILNDKSNSWLSRDSLWRKAWAFDQDCTLYVTTEESGTRALKLRLGESPEISLETDPTLSSQPMNLAKMTCISGDPFWYQDDVVYPVQTKKDTRSSTTLTATTALPTETLSINVDHFDGRGGLNPTDQAIWLKWTVPGSTQQVPSLPWPFPPNTAIPWDTAPFTQFTVPDYSFQKDDNADRRITTPGLIIGEDCVIDTDPRVEQFTSASGSNVWGRTNGVRFVNPVPPYTPSQKFEITVSGCPPGQFITLRIPRPWSRPWGLE